MGLTNLVLPQIKVGRSPFPRSSQQWADARQDILAPGGRFYLVAVQPNKPLEIAQYMRDQGMEADVSKSLGIYGMS